jgi:hypothetical protein
MKIEYALLADGAQASSGKIFILGGGWNVFRGANYPAPIQLAVAIGMGFTANEIGIKYPLKIVIADEAGVPVVPAVQGQIETGQPAADLPKGSSIKVPVAVNMSFAVPRPGKYGIVVTAGSSHAELSFDAIFVGQRVHFGSGPGPVIAPPERGN